MSGTSLDGIDAALVNLRPHAGGYDVKLERFTTVPFGAPMQARLLTALPPNEPSPRDLVALDADLGDLFAAAARAVAGEEAIDYIASHGLTAYHDGPRRTTMQIGDPYRLRDALAASVVFDFRRADCAAGGEGAPLVPYVDALLLSDDERDIVALNLGGIANVTVLRRGAAAQQAHAWDTGPGNMLLDAFVRMRTRGRELFDRNGAHASRGNVDRQVLSALEESAASFLALAPPKSTGRERFGSQMLDAHGALFATLSLEDGCATLCAFTVETITTGLAHAPPGARVVASGGGVRNAALLTMLRERLARDGAELVISDALGIDADAKEALAFAVLGYETLRGKPANLPAATGAKRPAILGAIAPFELQTLLDKVRAESR